LFRPKGPRQGGFSSSLRGQGLAEGERGSLGLGNRGHQNEKKKRDEGWGGTEWDGSIRVKNKSQRGRSKVKFSFTKRNFLGQVSGVEEVAIRRS